MEKESKEFFFFFFLISKILMIFFVPCWGLKLNLCFFSAGSAIKANVNTNGYVYTVISQFWSLPELLSLFSWYQISFWYTVNIIWVYYQWGNNATGQISDLFLQFQVTAGRLLASLSAWKVTTLMCLRKARRSRKKNTPGVLFLFRFVHFCRRVPRSELQP